MKALQSAVADGGVNTLSLTTLPRPTPTSPGQVLVQIKASAINPSDGLNAKGGFPLTTFPRIPGRDFAGVVVGPSSSPWLDKPVFGTSGNTFSISSDGAHAEYAVVEEGALAAKPANLTFAQAASLGVPYSTALVAVRKARVGKGDVVLVLGATGAVGRAAVDLVTEIGARVLTAARRDNADVDLRKDPELKTAKELTGGKGPDVVVDTIGNVELLGAALGVLAQSGRLSFISVGLSQGVDPTAFKVNLKKLYGMNQEILGCSGLAYGAVEQGGWLRELVPKFESGGLKGIAEQELTKVSIDDAVKAYEEVGKRSGKKYVIEFTETK